MSIKIQFARIGVNLVGSFLTDFQNSRGKFDEIKEEFMINPDPIPSELSLNVGGHDELKIFLEIRLIPSQIDQKLRTKKGEYMLFKEKFGSKIVGHWSGRGGDLQGSWERFHLARTRLQFCDVFDRISRSKSLQFLPRSHHDHAAIGPRSCVDRDPRAPSIIVGSSRVDSAAEGVQSRLDRGSIGLRSWGSSIHGLRRPMMLQVDG